MKKVIVDASIVVKWIINEHDTSAAVALLADWTRDEVAVLAPILLVSEVTNILYRSVKSGKLPYKDAKIGLEAVIFPAITFDLTNVLESKFFLHAIELAGQFTLPASYDAHYLALADLEQCEFWTADERLYNSVKDKLSWVRLMADYHPSATSA